MMIGTHRPIDFTETYNGCRECTSHCCNSEGYTVIRRSGKLVALHRRVYEGKHHRLKPGEKVTHTCGNRKCCNPEHLRAIMPAPKDIVSLATIATAAIMMNNCQT